MIVYLEDLPVETETEPEPAQTQYGTGLVRNPDAFVDRALAIDGVVNQTSS